MSDQGTNVERKSLTLLPVSDGCPECGSQHEPDQPHNRDSLHYNYLFHAQHGRWPTWKDACAHCSPELQALWKEELEVAGAKWE